MRKVLLSFFVLILASSFYLVGLDKRNENEKKLRVSSEDINNIQENDSFEAINISNSKVDSVEPHIVVNSNGTAYVVWERKTSPHSVFFNTNEGGFWGKAFQVSTGTNVSASEPWPDLAIDSTGKIHVVFTAKNRSGYYEIWYNSYSKSLAKSGWGSNVNISQSNSGSAYPAIACDPVNSNIYVVWMDQEFKAESWALFFRYKNASSSNWSKKVVLPINPSAYTPELTVDGLGRLHLIYLKRRGGSSVVYYTYNEIPTNLNTWKSPIAISNQTNLNFSHICIDSDDFGNVYVSWEQNNGGSREIYFRKRINGKWASIEKVSDTGSSTAYPDLAIDRGTGKLLLVWQQKKNNKWQIFGKSLLNGTWTATKSIIENNYNSIMPSLAIDNFGQIHLAFAEKYSGNYDIMYASTKIEESLPILPPIKLSLITKNDNFPGYKKNIIRWNKNPENDDAKVKNYLIFRKEVQQSENQYKLIAHLPKTTFSYVDGSLSKSKKFSYVLKTLDIDGNESSFSDEVAEPLVFPPIAISITSSLDSKNKKKINLISWKKNPLNSNATVNSYKIYRREAKQGSKFQFLVSVSGSTFSYKDKNLSTGVKYEYYLTATDSSGTECEPSLTAFEEPVFPPYSITIITAINESLFFNEKINVVSWQDNPLNEPVKVGHYRLYRKDLNFPDDEYRYIGAVDASVHRYFDRNLIVNHKYSYILTTVTNNGLESKESKPVNEK